MRGDSFSGISLGVENFAMIAGRHGRGGGRGRDCGHDSRGGRGHEDKSPRHCAHHGRNNYTSHKCWNKFGKLEWAQVVDASISTSAATSSTTLTVKIF